MLSTALDFPKGKGVTDHYSILAHDTVGFSEDLLPTWAQLSAEKMVKLSLISF